MKINTKTIITQLDGKPYKNPDGIVLKSEQDIENAPDLTLGHVIGKTLTVTKSNDPWRSYKLANEFSKDDEVEMKSEDVVFIKELLKEADWIPYIIGQSIDLLEGSK